MNDLSCKTPRHTGASSRRPPMGRAAALALSKAGAKFWFTTHGPQRSLSGCLRNPQKAPAPTRSRPNLSTTNWSHNFAGNVREIVGGRWTILVANAGVAKARKNR